MKIKASKVISQGHTASMWQLLFIPLFRLLNWKLANFFCEGWIVNISGFMGQETKPRILCRYFYNNRKNKFPYFFLLMKSKYNTL